MHVRVSSSIVTSETSLVRLCCPEPRSLRCNFSRVGPVLQIRKGNPRAGADQNSRHNLIRDDNTEDHFVSSFLTLFPDFTTSNTTQSHSSVGNSYCNKTRWRL